MLGLARFRPQGVRTGGSDVVSVARRRSKRLCRCRAKRGVTAQTVGGRVRSAVAEIVEQTVEAGVAPAGEAGGLAARAGTRPVRRGRAPEVLLDRREIAPLDRPGERVGRPERRSAFWTDERTSGSNASNGTPQWPTSRSTWPSNATRWFDATTAAVW